MSGKRDVIYDMHQHAPRSLSIDKKFEFYQRVVRANSFSIDRAIMSAIYGRLPKTKSTLQRSLQFSFLEWTVLLNHLMVEQNFDVCDI